MNYIFFDVDGVLNGTDQDGNWINDEIHIDKANRLVELAKATNAKLVMSSSWRTAWDKDGKLIKEENKWNLFLDILLREAGCELCSVTPVCNHERNIEIKLWLEENAGLDDKFVCLDDEYGYYVDDEFFNGKFIHTAPAHCNGSYGNEDVVGLFDEHVTKAIKILLI